MIKFICSNVYEQETLNSDVIAKRGYLKICINCDDNKVEDVEQYFMECKKYKREESYRRLGESK